MSTDSSRRPRILVGVVLLAVGVFVLVLAGTREDARSEPTVEPTRGGSTWPKEIEYRPVLFGPDAFEPPDTADPALHGLHLWVDLDGWFLWSVGSDREPVTLSVTVDSTFPEASIRTIGPADAVLLAPDVLVITFAPGGHDFAGVRFNPGFFTGEIEIRSTPEEATIGLGTGSVPADLPLQLRKGEGL